MTNRSAAGKFAALLFFLILPFTGPQNARAQGASARLPFSLIVNTGHREILDTVVYSSKGDILLSRDGSGAIKIWDAANIRLLRTVQQDSGDGPAALSPDGRLGAGNVNGGLVIWDLASGRPLEKLRKPANADQSYHVQSVAFDTDGSRILTADGEIHVYDVRTGALIRTLGAPNFHAMDGIFLSDQHSIFSLGSDGEGFALWDADSGKLVRRGKLATKSLYHSALSPDGAHLAVPVDDTSTNYKLEVFLYDVTTGKLLHRMSGFVDDVRVALSPDGRFLATGESRLIKIWDVSTGAMLRSFVGSADRILTLAFSPDGKRLVSGDMENLVRFWDVETGRPIGIAGSRIGEAVAVAGSPDGNYVLSGSGDGQGVIEHPAAPHDPGTTIRLWSLDSGRLVRSFAGNATFQEPVAFSRDSTRILTSKAGVLKTWDAADGRFLRDFNIGDKSEIGALEEMRDGQAIAALSTYDHSLKIVDATTGRVLHTMHEGENLLAESVSPDGRQVITSSSGKVLKLWDTGSGRLVRTMSGHSDHVGSVAFSPDGSRIASASGDNTLRIWDAASGRTLQTLRGHAGEVHSVAYDPTGRFLVSASEDSTIRIWDSGSGELLKTLRGHLGRVNAARFIRGGKLIASAGDDGMVMIWDASTGALLLTLAGFSNGDWVTMTPEGFFDASSEQAAEQLTLVHGLQWYAVKQFYQSLFRPDLVREKLAGDPRGLVRDAAAQLDLGKVIASGDAPEVHLTLPSRSLGTGPVTDESVTAVAEITDRGGGIGRVEWRLNGVTVGVDNPGQAAAQAVRLTRSLLLDAGDNAVEVVAYNKANLIASLPSNLHVAKVAAPAVAPRPAPNAAPSPAPVAAAMKPRLFALIAGVNDYADQRIRLSFAAPDAKEVARGFGLAAGNLYQSAEIKLMTDTEVTRGKLDAAFAELAGKIQPSDVFVVYFAGHGMTTDGRYYYIPQDFVIDGEQSDENINAAVKAKGITQEQLQRWFASIPARKSLILFDTCDSGTLTGDAAETQTLERNAANDRLAQATGRSIITASAGTQAALEGYHHHGLFTYELLDALGRADSDHNGTIEVAELAAFVYAQVFELSQKELHQRQTPQMKLTANYPLTRQTRIVVDESAPVAAARPTHQVAETAALQVAPDAGATVVRSLSANTAVTVLESHDGWSLVAADGRPLGYVATRDLAPAR